MNNSLANILNCIILDSFLTIHASYLFQNLL